MIRASAGELGGGDPRPARSLISFAALSSPPRKDPPSQPAAVHPLPQGMRDLLPAVARDQAALASRILGAFELHCYQRVVFPVFEYAELLERGLGALDPNDVLRFVEPDSGKVVALRPDMTPQVARLLSTRLVDAPLPARICYQGSVLRRRRERARRHQQIPQAGIELVGLPAPDGDLEVLEVASAAVRAAGLDDFVLDLGHARIAASLIEQAEPGARAGLVEALGLKDGSELSRRAKASGLSGRELDALSALPDLHGGEAVFRAARAALTGTAAEPALGELERLWQAAQQRGLARRLVVDLGETWSFAYYTGAMFQILAEGPGQSVGSGGRYDGLLERFGTPRSAAGFAFDLDNLGWALGTAGVRPSASKALLVQGGEPALLGALRERRVACAAAPASSAQAYAASWGYTHLLRVEAQRARLVHRESGKSDEIAFDDFDGLAGEVASRLSSTT